MSHQYYRVKGQWTTEMIQKLGNAQTTNQVMAHNLESALSLKNPWRLKQLKEHDNYTQISKHAEIIEKKLNGQSKDL